MLTKFVSINAAYLPAVSPNLKKRGYFCRCTLNELI